MGDFSHFTIGVSVGIIGCFYLSQLITSVCCVADVFCGLPGAIKCPIALIAAENEKIALSLVQFYIRGGQIGQLVERVESRAIAKEMFFEEHECLSQ